MAGLKKIVTITDCIVIFTSQPLTIAGLNSKDKAGINNGWVGLQPRLTPSFFFFTKQPFKMAFYRKPAIYNGRVAKYLFKFKY